MGGNLDCKEIKMKKDANEGKLGGICENKSQEISGYVLIPI